MFKVFVERRVNEEENRVKRIFLEDVENDLKEGNTSMILHEKVIKKKNGINLEVWPIHILSSTHTIAMMMMKKF